MKPLIVGMNNPQGNPPLWPDPPGCSGWRLWQMLNAASDSYISKDDYLAAFDRVNLCPGSTWDRALARQRAEGIWEQMRGRPTILLGRSVTGCLGLGQPPWMVWSSSGNIRWIPVPHPSGMTRAYNSERFRCMVGDVLFELYRESVRQAT